MKHSGFGDGRDDGSTPDGDGYGDGLWLYKGRGVLLDPTVGRGDGAIAGSLRFGMGFHELPAEEIAQ